MNGSVRKRGNTWSYRIDLGIVDGSRKQKETGGFKKKSEAHSALRKAIDELENTGGVFEPTTISFSDYLNYFIENYIEIHLRENSQRARQHIIKNHIRPAFGNYKIMQITSQALQNFITKKSKAYSKNYISMIHATLSTAFKMAVEWEFIRINPMTRVKVPKRDDQEMDKEIKTLSPEEVNRCAERLQGTHHYIPFMIAFHTGLRAGEVSALQWSDIDFDNQMLSVTKRLDYSASKENWEFKPPKTRSSNRTIAIGNELITILKSHSINQKKNKLKYGKHYTENDFICTFENGEVVITKAIGRVSEIIIRDVKIDFNFHMLRHTHATMLLEAGINPKVVQERLGHSTVSITLDTYSHITIEFQKTAVLEYEKYLQKIKIAHES
ncbi:phage integrase family protein [Alkaliphilus metalliredigens QYMF]|uniref:Phage integrase family protein n=1 Tax=Alkaliphilus metalliredigens (strain QYMF) TaxID=293826 RepID=A6TLJ2_ALKMQ|nr:site-specific integrase [Alkaliphilus metalliredigens]ABR47060.1 phage integrase family protein [Alkaliphilus metalliredigens QYMF]